MILLISCDKTPSESPFDHNSAVQGFVGFEDASPDTLTATIDVYFNTTNETIKITSVNSDNTGFYAITDLSAGNYSLLFFSGLYEDMMQSIELSSNQTTIMDTIDLQLPEPIVFLQVIVDGVIDDGWETVYENTHESNWEGNDFENLYLARDDDSLYIAINGTFSSGDNAVNIYIDKDYNEGTGIYDFTEIQGGGYGDHLRKNVTTPDYFGADLAFTAWTLTDDVGVVSLEDPQSVDQNVLENTIISANSSVIEFSIPFSDLYIDAEIPIGKKIALVAVIGGGGNEYFADDTIPQQVDFNGNFVTVFSRAY